MCQAIFPLEMHQETFGFVVEGARDLQQYNQRVHMQLPKRSRVFAALKFFELCSHTGADRDCAQKNAGNFGKDAFVFLSPIAGAIGVSLRWRQNKIEEAHRHDLAKFRIRHANEDSNRLLDLDKPGLFSGNLRWSNGLSHRVHVQRGPTDNRSSCRRAGGFADTAWRGSLCRTTYGGTALQRFSELGHPV